MGEHGEFMTADELLRMTDLPPCELVRGRLRLEQYKDMLHGLTASRVFMLLANYTHGNPIADVLIRVGFIVARNPDTVLAPDIAVVRRSRVKRPNPGYFPGPPDLAVEIETGEYDVAWAAGRWLEAGTDLVWVVSVPDQTVTVHRSDKVPQTLRNGNVMSGEEVLPGFECAVAELFKQDC